jgi:S-DNA-T family DNA segregation ATPase FtsK/SpoIIIE
VTQQVSNKKSAEKPPENTQNTHNKEAPPKPSFQARYEVQPEFWDRILDSIPPWGDEIAAILLIVFGIVSFLSLLNVSSDATISTAWKNALTALFGYGSYIVSGGILILGVLILLPKAGINIPLSRSRILALQVAFLSLLAILHLTSGDLEWRALARAGQGGGVIGWGLSMLIGGLLSSTFALFIYGVLFIICIAHVGGVKATHVIGFLQNISRQLSAYSEKASRIPERPRRQRLTVPEPVVTPDEAGPAPHQRRTMIMRIRPDPQSIPPSQRAGAQPAKPEALDTLSSVIEAPEVSSNHIIPEFNAIGTLKERKRKTDIQLVERPDGRVKRYFSVENMAEPKRTGKREAELPPLDMLRDVEFNPPDEEEINTNVVLIENTLLEFEIDVDVVEVKVGPTVTRYAVQPFKEKPDGEGETVVERTRINKIASLASDLALSLAAKRLRLETPVPGTNYIGVEVPNKKPGIVTLRSVYESRYFFELMQKKKSPLLVPLGRDVAGMPVAVDIGQMPHLLIAGTTGSGKSVAIAALTTAIILNNTPDLVKLVLLDPKMVELSRFNGLPHLIGPAETDQERIIEVLRWCTREMDRRYKLLEEHAARNIDTYNSRLGRRQQDERLPYIVIMIDEIGDLMLSRPDETEKTITRLAQMARAVGMHLIVATQRPSVDVITGLIKANFPSRMSFAVASGIDSRVILDSVGAETLLGQGDMLYLANDAAGPRRIQGCYVSDDEVRAVVNYWKDWQDKQVKAGKMKPVRIGPWERGVTRRELLSETDPMLEEAIEMVIAEGEASASLIQRKMGLGYPRAARMIDLMHELRVIGPPEAGGRSRKVLIKPGEDPFKEEIDKRSKEK